MTNARIDFINRKIVITKSFAEKASNPRAKENAELMELMEKYVGFGIEVVKDTKKNKKTNKVKALSYKEMVEYITTYHEADLEEFKNLKAQFVLRGSVYHAICEWFEEKYKEDKELVNRAEKKAKIVVKRNEKTVQFNPKAKVKLAVNQ